MSLMDLPPEILTIILSYVPKRKHLTEVCKSFYHAICFLDEKSTWIKVTEDDILLTGEFYTNLPALLKDLQIEQQKLNSIDFLEKFGRHINDVQITGKVQQSQLNYILKQVPNCTALDIRGATIIKEQHGDFTGIEVNLPHLKRFTTKLNNPDEQELKLNFKILEQCTLDSFHCSLHAKDHSEHFLTELSRMQRNLKELKLADFNIFDFNFNLEHLETLEIFVNGTLGEYNCDGFVRLKNFKNLSLLVDGNIEKFPFFTGSHVMSVDNLKIKTNIMKEGFCRNLAEFFNPKSLDITAITLKNVNVIGEAMRSFNKVENLKIYYKIIEDEFTEVFDNFDWTNCENLNLKCLSLEMQHGSIDSKLFQNFYANYPNLTQLNVGRTTFSLFDNVIDESRDESERILRKKLDEKLNGRESASFKKLLIDNYEKGSKMDCFLNSTRKFTNIQIDAGNSSPNELGLLFKLLEKQSENIKLVKLKGSLSESELSKLLSLIPKCKTLFLRNLDVKMGPKKFKLATGSIEELQYNVNCAPAEILGNIIASQPKLYKLVLTNLSFGHGPKEIVGQLENYQLEHLEWKSPRPLILDEQTRHAISLILKNQKKLKVLKIDFALWNEMFIEIVHNCRDLEELEVMEAMSLRKASFVHIKSLKKLKVLTLGSHYYGGYESLRGILVDIKRSGRVVLNLSNFINNNI